MTIEQIEKLITEMPLTWNPLQTPEWHLAMWRSTIIYEIKKFEKAGKR